jgi:galactose-1-phosphate uridylyltransferase
MEPMKRPNPLTDELTDEAKAALAKIFANLKAQYSTDFHQQWRVYQRLHNAGMNQQMFDATYWEEVERRRQRWMARLNGQSGNIL